MNNNYFFGEKVKQGNLDFDEEKELSQKILAGEKARKVLSDQAALSEDERGRLELAVQEGDLACTRLVSANIPRAMKFAYETWRKNPLGVNDLYDYQQTAVKVIWICARTFNWEKGNRFGTYAHNCLRNEMLRENARTCYALRIPEENLLHLAAGKDQEKSAADGGRSGCGMTDQAMKKLRAACTRGTSLNASFGDDGTDTEFGEMIPDPEAITAEQIEEQIDRNECLKRLRKALEALPEDERDLLKGRMGYFGEPQTLRSLVGTVAKSVSGVQKKQLAAVMHLRELYYGLPLAG